jgi:hypothetical protein
MHQRVIFLIEQGSPDEGYHWVAQVQGYNDDGSPAYENIAEDKHYPALLIKVALWLQDCGEYKSYIPIRMSGD